MNDSGKQEGIILKGIGGFYYAQTEDGVIHTLRAKGIFRKRGTPPMIGDHILLSPNVGDEHGWIEEILPRKNQLIRPPVVNIAHIMIVIAPAPAPDYLLVDTLLIMAIQQGIEPVIVVNKCDINKTVIDDVNREYTPLKIPILAVSATTGEGIEELSKLMKKGIVCFAGQSGVGKSTLLSMITGLKLQTGEISQKIARGKHTTRHAELLMANGYQVLDTPGFSLLALQEEMEPIKLKQYYPEFEEFEGECKFSPCYHLSEPGCKVIQACEAGKIGAGRLQRYHQILMELQKVWKKRYD